MNAHKDHADVKIHPPILLLIHLFAAYLLNRFAPLSFVFPKILVWIGYIPVVIGIGLAISAARRFMRAHITLDPHGSVSNIVTTGPYRFTRNPIYIGMVCFLIGFPLIFKSY